MSLETTIQSWLEERVAAEPTGQPLQGVQICDSAFDKITAEAAVMIGPADSRFAPQAQGSAGEFDGQILLIILVLVVGREAPAFTAARERAIAIASRIAYFAQVEDNDLGGRVRDSLPGKFKRSFTPEAGQKYAVGNLPLFVNVAGQQIGGQA